ncbi:MAG: winged helix-turn-helix domain-containing protein, partial [Pseudomonadota bacterium]
MELCTYQVGEIVNMNLQAMRRQAVPLHAEVAEVLRHQILSGDLPAGTKLPALSTLTEELGVARMTIVQAMNALEDEGLIEKHSGRGTFVRPVKLPDRHRMHLRAELDQIYAMVDQLE